MFSFELLVWLIEQVTELSVEILLASASRSLRRYAKERESRIAKPGGGLVLHLMSLFDWLTA